MFFFLNILLLTFLNRQGFHESKNISCCDNSRFQWNFLPTYFFHSAYSSLFRNSVVECAFYCCKIIFVSMHLACTRIPGKDPFGCHFGSSALPNKESDSPGVPVLPFL